MKKKKQRAGRPAGRDNESLRKTADLDPGVPGAGGSAVGQPAEDCVLSGCAENSESPGTEAGELPPAFLIRMRTLMEAGEYGEFLSSYEQERRFSLRVNTLKCSPRIFVRLAGELTALNTAGASSRDSGEEETPELSGGIQARKRGGENSGEEETPELSGGIQARKRGGENSVGEETPEHFGGKPAGGREEENNRVDGEAKQGMSAVLLGVPWEPCGFFYPEKMRPGRLPWHEAGMYYIQEASAMLPAVLCGARPGERVLDLCAAPGGKSTKLAADLCGEGLLVANEIHPERAKVLSSNMERMGVRNVVVTCASPGELASRFPLFFDRIVVDAPCSGEGMFRKEKEAISQWSPENVALCAERQAQILEEAASMLRSGGTLVYSTCTFSPEENEGSIYRFLLLRPEFSIVPVRDILGSDMEKWGLEGGRPEWAGDPPVGGKKLTEDAGSANERESSVSPGSEAYLEEYSPGKEGEEMIAGSEVPDRQRIRDSLRGTARLWPHRLPGEGHFAAVLKKRESSSSAMRVYTETDIIDRRSRRLNSEKRTGIRSGTKKRGGRKGADEQSDRKLEEAWKLWQEFVRGNLRLSGREDADSMNSLASYALFGDVLWLLPLPEDRLSLRGLRVLRTGLQLGSVTRGRFEPSHALAMALTAGEAVRTAELSGLSPEAFAWFRGETLPLEEDPGKGWCLVLIDGCSAGWGKSAGGMLKNHYPRGLRKGSWYQCS